MADYGYKAKGEVTLAWLDNREKIALQGRQLLRRVLDVALDELDREFKAALHRGEILQLDKSKAELRSLLLTTAQRELGSGDDR